MYKGLFPKIKNPAKNKQLLQKKKSRWTMLKKMKKFKKNQQRYQIK